MTATKPDHDAVPLVQLLPFVDEQEGEHIVPHDPDLDHHHHAHPSETKKDATDASPAEATLLPLRLVTTTDEDMPPQHHPIPHRDVDILTPHLLMKEADEERRDTPRHLHAPHPPSKGEGTIPGPVQDTITLTIVIVTATEIDWTAKKETQIEEGAELERRIISRWLTETGEIKEERKGDLDGLSSTLLWMSSGRLQRESSPVNREHGKWLRFKDDVSYPFVVLFVLWTFLLFSFF